MSGKPAYEDDDQLLLGAAAAFVGVHPDTLRRWADAGRVPVLRTPTNHRKFLVGDLRKLIVPEQRSSSDEPDDVDAEDDRVRPRVGAA